MGAVQFVMERACAKSVHSTVDQEAKAEIESRWAEHTLKDLQ